MTWERQPDPTVFSIVHFVELDDGRQLTTEEFGEISMSIALDLTQDELREEVREVIFEDEMRNIPELADDPRWEDMLQVLARAGVPSDEASLAQLPFVVELGGDVLAELGG